MKSEANDAAEIFEAHKEILEDAAGFIDPVMNRIHKNSNIPCGMCGEAASDLKLIPLLIGIGLKEFSMSSSSILSLRKLINSLSYESCRKIADKVLRLATTKEIKDELNKNQ